jgi:hypothetical protein
VGARVRVKKRRKKEKKERKKERKRKRARERVRESSKRSYLEEVAGMHPSTLFFAFPREQPPQPLDRK